MNGSSDTGPEVSVDRIDTDYLSVDMHLVRVRFGSLNFTECQ